MTSCSLSGAGIISLLSFVWAEPGLARTPSPRVRGRVSEDGPADHEADPTAGGTRGFHARPSCRLAGPDTGHSGRTYAARPEAFYLIDLGDQLNGTGIIPLSPTPSPLHAVLSDRSAHQ